MRREPARTFPFPIARSADSLSSFAIVDTTRAACRVKSSTKSPCVLSRNLNCRLCPDEAVPGSASTKSRRRLQTLPRCRPKWNDCRPSWSGSSTRVPLIANGSWRSWRPTAPLRNTNRRHRRVLRLRAGPAIRPSNGLPRLPERPTSPEAGATRIRPRMKWQQRCCRSCRWRPRVKSNISARRAFSWVVSWSWSQGLDAAYKRLYAVPPRPGRAPESTRHARQSLEQSRRNSLHARCTGRHARTSPRNVSRLHPEDRLRDWRY